MFEQLNQIIVSVYWEKIYLATLQLGRVAFPIDLHCSAGIHIHPPTHTHLPLNNENTFVLVNIFADFECGL